MTWGSLRAPPPPSYPASALPLPQGRACWNPGLWPQAVTDGTVLLLRWRHTDSWAPALGRAAGLGPAGLAAPPSLAAQVHSLSVLGPAAPGPGLCLSGCSWEEAEEMDGRTRGTRKTGQTRRRWCLGTVPAALERCGGAVTHLSCHGCFVTEQTELPLEFKLFFSPHKGNLFTENNNLRSLVQRRRPPPPPPCGCCRGGGGMG